MINGRDPALYTSYDYRTFRQAFTMVGCILVVIIFSAFEVYMMTGNIKITDSNADLMFPIGFGVGTLLALWAAVYMVLLWINAKVLIGPDDIICLDYRGRVAFDAKMADVTTDLTADADPIARDRNCMVKAGDNVFGFSNSIRGYDDLVIQLRDIGKAGWTSSFEPDYQQ